MFCINNERCEFGGKKNVGNRVPTLNVTNSCVIVSTWSSIKFSYQNAAAVAAEAGHHSAIERVAALYINPYFTQSDRYPPRNLRNHFINKSSDILSRQA